MKTQIKEAARQILGNVSDIQAEVSLCSGFNEISYKLASIREAAAFLLEGKKGLGKVVEGYEADADQTMILLGEKIDDFTAKLASGEPITGDERILIMRLSELLVKRTRVCLDRRNRQFPILKHSAKKMELLHVN